MRFFIADPAEGGLVRMGWGRSERGVMYSPTPMQ